MQIILIIFMVLALFFGCCVCVETFWNIIDRHERHDMEEEFWQIRRERIKEQANEKVKNPTQKGEVHENHKN